MNVLTPYDIEDKLVSSTASDTLSSYSEWDETITYVAGDEVQYDHTLYTALVPDDCTNLAQTPGPNNTTYWTGGDPSNKWAMFDSYVSTQTLVDTVDTNLVIVLDSSKVDSYAFLNCENIETIFISVVYNPTGLEVVSINEDLVYYDQDAVSSSWYEYFFGDVEYREDFYVETTPYTDSKVTITLTPVAGYAVSIGHFAMGETKNIGTAKYGIAPSFSDYSTVTRNTTSGKTSFAQGNYTKDLSVPLSISNARLDTVYKILAKLRATPAVWNANEDDAEYDAVIAFGFIRDFTVTIPGKQRSTCSLTIEGLV